MVSTQRMGSSEHSSSIDSVWDFKNDFDPETLSKPISLNDLMRNCNHQVNDKENDSSFDVVHSNNSKVPKPQKSCVKSSTCPIEAAFGDNSSGSKKSVKFATNKQDDKVWCLVKEYEREEDEEVLAEMFWSAGELRENVMDDKEQLRSSTERFKYRHALAAAYKVSAAAATSNEEIDLDFETLAECSEARGLELDVYPLVRRFAKKHRRAVLVVQDTLRDEGRPMFDDLSLNLIRKASVKYSRPIRMVATRLAEFDKRDSLLSETDEPLVSDDESDEEARSLHDSLMEKSESAMASYSEFQDTEDLVEGRFDPTESDSSSPPSDRPPVMKRTEASVF